MKHLAVIPFSGFYCSAHSEMLDREMDDALTDSSGCHPISDRLTDLFHRHAGYTDAMLAAYAREYLAAWSDASGIAVEFESVTSPREYNFTTDRIFAYLESATVRALFSKLDAARMDQVCLSRHKSRDGFISFYSYDWRTWGEPETWEPEQLHSLILASLPDDMPESEHDLMERAVSNGYVHNAVWNNIQPEALRIANIAGYLRQREERGFRR
jgi:hypothetical protein